MPRPVLVDEQSLRVAFQIVAMGYVVVFPPRGLTDDEVVELAVRWDAIIVTMDGGFFRHKRFYETVGKRYDVVRWTPGAGSGGSRKTLRDRLAKIQGVGHEAKVPEGVGEAEHGGLPGGVPEGEAVRDRLPDGPEVGGADAGGGGGVL